MARAYEVPWLDGIRVLLGRPIEDPFHEQWSAVRSFGLPNWLPSVSQDLNALSELDRNWDSYGAGAVSQKAVLAARMIFSRLNISNHPKPHVCAVSGGGVGIHWRIGARDLEIEVAPAGEISYLKTELPGDIVPGTVKNVEELEPALYWVLGQ